ncbi:MAG: hypothetical protein N2749_07230 [Clostridia bacterium]|nr:hypothetical protein [Clostridia bacterium]
MKYRNVNMVGRKYSDKNVKSAKNKKVIYEIKPRFYAVIIVIILILVLLIINSVKKDIVIDDSLNVMAINVSKYSDEIKIQYEKTGEKDKFINEYNIVQQSVGMYIMNNSTVDSTSYDNLLKDIKKELKKSDWSKLNMQKSTYWAGNWTVNDEGMVKFKFSSKKVEPDWIRDNDISNMFEYN